MKADEQSIWKPWMILLVVPLLSLVIVLGILLSNGDESGSNEETNRSSSYLDDFTPLPITLPPRTPLPSPTSIFDQPVPNIVLTDLAGESFTLRDYEGRPLVVNFWASWCVPCREEIPAFQEYHDATQEDGAVIILVTDPDNGQTLDDIRAFVEEFDLNLRVGIDQNARLHYALNVLGLPSTYFVDADGIMQGRRTGIVSYDDLIEEVALLNE